MLQLHPTTKAALPGFYDLAPTQTKQLFIHYTFRHHPPSECSGELCAYSSPPSNVLEEVCASNSCWFLSFDRGKAHEVTIDDGDAIRLPIQT